MTKDSGRIDDEKQMCQDNANLCYPSAGELRKPQSLRGEDVARLANMQGMLTST
jgi:hypothetical protein